MLLQRPESMLTFEGAPIQGVQGITERLTVRVSVVLLLIAALVPDAVISQGLPFEKVQHKITTLDAQPSSPSLPSIIVSVTGLLVVSFT
jgi:hypothetical protein